MKILVTGATGFIGTRLVKRLCEERHYVVCIIRKTSNVKGLQGTGAKLVTADITDVTELERIFYREMPDIVFHCAASVRDPDEKKLFNINVQGTRNILELSFIYRVKRVVYLSSIAVINGNHETPLTDEFPYSARNAYGRSKVEAEKIALDYRQRGLNVAILRPCMVYGEGEPHALDRILSLVKKRLTPVPDLPDVENKLHLVYVGNLVQAMELAMKKKEALQGTFLIADKGVITIRKFLEIASEELGAGKPRAIPGWLMKLAIALPPVRRFFNDLLKNREYDISRAEGLLGYRPEMSTEEALRKTVRYWKENSC